MDTRFGTWSVRSLHTAGSLGTVASELAVKEVRWVEGGSQLTKDYTCFLWK
jgi:hypothetical protein